MPSLLQVRTLSPWPADFTIAGAHFSPEIPADSADALLCSWGPSEELFRFPRRKAWYSVEPPCQFNSIEGGTWPSIRDRLAPHEFLCFNHPDPRFRIPESTHFAPLTVNRQTDRKHLAVAVVSNYGGNPWRGRSADFKYRNRLILHPEVDLYGREGWTRYRKHRFSLFSSPPPNYRGSLPGDWETTEKRNLLASYDVVICLENAWEPFSFSEKFVEAACAGAVPVYRAHPSVRDYFLKGAQWIDPLDFDGDPKRTLEAALAADRESIAAANEKWLMESEALASTHHDEVFAKIAQALRESA